MEEDLVQFQDLHYHRVEGEPKVGGEEVTEGDQLIGMRPHRGLARRRRACEARLEDTADLHVVYHHVRHAALPKRTSRWSTSTFARSHIFEGRHEGSEAEAKAKQKKKQGKG